MNLLRLKIFIFLCFLFLWAQNIFAQRNRKPTLFNNYIEIGINYCNFFDNKGMELSLFTRYAFDFGQHFLEPRYIFSKIGYLHWGYKYFFNSKQCIHYNFQSFGATYPTDAMIIGMLSSRTYKIIGIGYGYKLTKKKIELLLTSELAYRYQGGEFVVYNFTYSGLPFVETHEAQLNYNSMGISTGMDASYFFLPKLGIGVKTNYYLFPFENGKLHDNGIELTNPRLIDSYHANKQLLTFNLKLSYRFNFKTSKLDDNNK